MPREIVGAIPGLRVRIDDRSRGRGYYLGAVEGDVLHVAERDEQNVIGLHRHVGLLSLFHGAKRNGNLGCPVARLSNQFHFGHDGSLARATGDACNPIDGRKTLPKNRPIRKVVGETEILRYVVRIEIGEV